MYIYIYTNVCFISSIGTLEQNNTQRWIHSESNNKTSHLPTESTNILEVRTVAAASVCKVLGIVFFHGAMFWLKKSYVNPIGSMGRLYIYLQMVDF